VDHHMMATKARMLTCGAVNTDPDTQDEDYCVTSHIANPDNVAMIPDYNQLIIGEDTGKHMNNLIWIYELDIPGGAMTRVAHTPVGAETTSPYWFTVGKFNYMTYVVQHPRSDVTGYDGWVGYVGPFPRIEYGAFSNEGAYGWGSPRFEDCSLDLAWPEISIAQKYGRRGIWTGGLGDIMEAYKFEVWLCVDGYGGDTTHTCAARGKPFCYVYDEDAAKNEDKAVKAWIPWGPDSELHLIESANHYATEGRDGPGMSSAPASSVPRHRTTGFNGANVRKETPSSTPAPAAQLRRSMIDRLGEKKIANAASVRKSEASKASADKVKKVQAETKDVKKAHDSAAIRKSGTSKMTTSAQKSANQTKKSTNKNINVKKAASFEARPNTMRHK